MFSYAPTHWQCAYTHTRNTHTHTHTHATHKHTHTHTHIHKANIQWAVSMLGVVEAPSISFPGPPPKCVRQAQGGGLHRVAWDCIQTAEAVRNTVMSMCVCVSKMGRHPSVP
ncbi:unnamed protein product [Arctogadus glacialis]